MDHMVYLHHISGRKKSIQNLVLASLYFLGFIQTNLENLCFSRDRFFFVAHFNARIRISNIKMIV